MRMYWIFGLLLVANYGGSQEVDKCKCVIYYLCSKDTGTIITDGRGIINERIGVEKCTCNCTKPNEVCCYLNTTIDATERAVSPTEPSTTLSSTITTPSSTSSSGKLLGCGFANPDGIGYKLGVDATDVAFGEFPWMVVILVNGENHRCGGSLIHPSVVLTAAHCVTKTQIYTVRAGEWDSSNTRELFKHQNRKVSSIKIHEDYMPGIYHNDIALLFLESPFNLEEHIKVACLPPKNTVVESVKCYATGWGKDKFGGEGKYAAILKKVSLPIVNNAKCQENLRQTALGGYFNLHKSFLCAGGNKNEDSCIGDGGGPLVCPISGEEDRYQQIGITSWGIGCNEENVPGVYTNIPVLRDWIDKKIKEKNFDTAIYQY